VPVPDENAFPYGRFRSRNIKNDYAAERHVTDGKTSEFIYKIMMIIIKQAHKRVGLTGWD
jgi:hypothetical protein